MVLVMAFFLITYTFHSTWVTSEAYSSPSIVLSARGGDGSRIIFDDFREAYYWLRHNTPEVKLEGAFLGPRGAFSVPSMAHKQKQNSLLFLFPVPSGLKSDVVVGLRVPNHSYGKPDHFSGQ